MGVKISELTQASMCQNTDVLPIVQNGETKKIEKQTLLQSIENEINYKTGDTFSLSSRVILSGMITGDAEEIVFTVFTDKSLKNISTITINILNLSIRIPSGGYVIGANTNFISYASITNQFDGGFSISLRNNSGWGITNNTPVSVAVENLEVSYT